MDNAQRALDLTAEDRPARKRRGRGLARRHLARCSARRQDVRQLIKHKNVYEFLENAIDKCQDVANVIESVVVENV